MGTYSERQRARGDEKETTTNNYESLTGGVLSNIDLLFWQKGGVGSGVSGLVLSGWVGLADFGCQFGFGAS